MANSYFQCKRFRIAQEDAAMKVGTDGVLLGAWARVDEGMLRLLDIGTGTGLIALMLAQRLEDRKPGRRPASGPGVSAGHRHPELSGSGSPADRSAGTRAEEAACRIDAIEVDAGAARQAAGNVTASPWPEVVRVIHTSLQSFAADPARHGRYDHIVSNPPYYTNALRSPDGSRDRARHTDSLPYDELIAGTVQLLAPEGVFSVVLPLAESRDFVTRAVAAGLHPRRRTEVCTTAGAPPKRVLIEFGTRITLSMRDTLVIRNAANDGFSEAYRLLTQDFYLGF